MTGLDLGKDDGIHTQGDLLQRMHSKLQDKIKADEAVGGAQATRRRQTPAQQRREAEAQQVTQSVREVFRKLPSTLHPDRETDPQQREVKTALMQKVNQAYSSNDLLTLLR